MAALAVAEGAAQRAYLNLQVRVFDECLRPRAGHQLLLGHDRARAVDKGGQDVEGAAAQPHRPVALEQEPLRSKEPERTKRDRVPVQGGGCRRHPFFYQIFLDCGQRNTAGASFGAADLGHARQPRKISRFAGVAARSTSVAARSPFAVATSFDRAFWNFTGRDAREVPSRAREVIAWRNDGDAND